LSPCSQNSTMWHYDTQSWLNTICTKSSSHLNSLLLKFGKA
jgi:hypothetical protein